MVEDIAWLIFIRANSKRLPNKCYYKLQGNTILEHLFIRAYGLGIKNKNIFLCTSLDESCDALCEISNSLKIETIRGDEEFPIKRLNNLQTKLRLKNFKYFVRICGDSPFYSFNLTIKAFNFYKKKYGEFFCLTNGRLRNFPSGMGIELYNLRKFFQLLDSKTELNYIEHMIEIAYEIDAGKIVDIRNNFIFKEVISNKLTLDTQIDYYNLCDYFAENLESKIESEVEKLIFL